MRGERLQNALFEAFPQRSDLEQMILFGLGQELDGIVSGANQNDTIFAVLKWARARGKLDRLLDQACAKNPDNLALRAVAEDRAPFIVSFAEDSSSVGRGDDLKRLHQRLRERRSLSCGARRHGGIGKTQIACEYAHGYRRFTPAASTG